MNNQVPVVNGLRQRLLNVNILIAVVITLPARVQQKPFTQEQVQGLVRSRLGDETGARAIEQRGVDSALTEDFLQSLNAADANEAFVQAPRAAKRPQPPSEAEKKPLNQVQVITLLAGRVPSHRVTILVLQRGIDFDPTDDYLQEVRLAPSQLLSPVRY
ncbi:MAG: hypothetical protein ABSH01_14825 [Terriglobia bacterium]